MTGIGGCSASCFPKSTLGSGGAGISSAEPWAPHEIRQPAAAPSAGSAVQQQWAVARCRPGWHEQVWPAMAQDEGAAVRWINGAPAASTSQTMRDQAVPVCHLATRILQP